MALVLIDVDGTLLYGPSSEREFVRHLVLNRRLGARQALATLGFALREALRPGGAPFKRNKAWLAALGVAEITAQAEDFVAARLLPRLRPELLQRIDAHREADDRPVLLTGTPDFLARPLAGALGIDDCIATACAADGMRYLAAAPWRHPFGLAKLDLARAFAETCGEALEEASAYADSGDDVALLEAVRYPVAVAPDRTLARVARQRGWEILGVAPLRNRRCSRWRTGTPSSLSGRAGR